MMKLYTPPCPECGKPTTKIRHDHPTWICWDCHTVIAMIPADEIDFVLRTDPSWKRTPSGNFARKADD